MTRRQTASADPRHIFDEHVHLRRMLDEVRELLVARHATGAMVVAIFEELHHGVLDHFEHEEEGGYFSQALAEAPRLSERAEQLLAEHPEMAAQLAAMRKHARQAGSSRPGWDELHAMFNDFVRRFERHEAGENALLHEAYNRDLGAED